MARKKPGNMPRKGCSFNKITRFEFSATHYLKKQYDSDMFYVAVANNLLPLLQDSLCGNPSFTDAHIRKLALNLTCYLEDLVSYTGIWGAFVSLCRKKYGTAMPFFDVSDEEELKEYPTSQAVGFIIWLTLNEISQNTVLNPENEVIKALAILVAGILNVAYDEAPDTLGRVMIQPEEVIGVPVFFQIRNMCWWLCHDCYLTSTANLENAESECADFLDSILNRDAMEELPLDYAMIAFEPFNTLIGPLGITAQEWLAEIMQQYHDDSEAQFLPIVGNLKSLPYKVYRIKSVAKTEAILVDVAGESYTLSAYSMPGETFPETFKQGDSVIYSLALFDGKWNINGLGLTSMPSKFYDEVRELYVKHQENNKRTLEYYSKKLKGKRIGIVGSFEELQDKLALPENKNVQIPKGLEIADNIVFFLNSDGTLSLLKDFGDSVKIRGNKFYDKEIAADCGVSLIFDTDLTSEEMRRYLIDNGCLCDATLISSVSNKAGHKLLQDNIQFFADYARRGMILYSSVEMGMHELL